MARNYKDIELWKNVTQEQWDDWHWQVANRITNIEDLKKVINLTEAEEKDIEEVTKNFRMGITPYYASLMDVDDPRCPVRMQAVPVISENHRSE
ncbi:MAG TPA: lysine 2,3-aminomutase, partial [Clostridiales bacterium]|nr:lysine 2,3-aminomutase [Clostridiales bacterium]